MSVSEKSSPTPPFLVIYQSRVKAMRSITLSLALLLGGVWLFLTPTNEDDLLGRTAHLLGAYTGPPVAILMLILSVMQFFAKKPLLIFDDEGITTRGCGLIPWSAIAAVALNDTMRRRFFAIVPRDIETLASQYPAAIGRRLRFNQQTMGIATGIGEASLPMTIDALLARVGGYCDEKIRQHQCARGQAEA